MLTVKHLPIFTVILGCLSLVHSETSQDNFESSPGSMEVEELVSLSRKEFRNLTRKASPEEFGKYVYFKYFKNGQPSYVGTGVNSESLTQTGCTASDHFAFILHGWRQNCETEWVSLLIATCDMAGPGFDYKVSQIDHRTAAQNVQCIHTSRDRGTRYYNCHQNWRLGNCGYNQIAATEPPRGSHGLCPYFYVSAFDHDFFAMRMPPRCSSKRQALFWPQNFKMGYMEQRKHMVSGELFAYTSPNYPYNAIPSIIMTQLDEASAAYDQQQYLKGKPVLNSIIRARKLMKKRRRLL